MGTRDVVFLQMTIATKDDICDITGSKENIKTLRIKHSHFNQ